MQREQITDKEAIYLIIPFIIGSTLVIGSGGDAKNDAWISIIVGIFMFVPMLLVYSRLIALFQGQDLFAILNLTMGKVIGKIITLIYTWYAFHLGALVLRNFGEFTNTIALPETPMFVSLLILGFAVIMAARLGIEVLGRTCTYLLLMVFFILLVVLLLGLSEIHFDYLKPIFGHGLIPILKGGFATFAFPFAETVLFIGVFGALQTKKSPLKVYSWGTLVAGILLVIVTIRNIVMLGKMLGSFYFPSYEAVSIITIGQFIQRIEISVSIVFVFGVFVKSSICLLFASKGIASIFNLKDYRCIVIQTGLLMVYLAYIIYDDIMQMQFWAFKVYAYYAFPMQVILPIMIWILAEVKARKATGHN